LISYLFAREENWETEKFYKHTRKGLKNQEDLGLFSAFLEIFNEEEQNDR